MQPKTAVGLAAALLAATAVGGTAYGQTLTPSRQSPQLAGAGSHLPRKTQPLPNSGGKKVQEDYSYQAKGTVCVQRPGLPGDWARVRVLMRVGPRADTNIFSLRLKARWVAAGARSIPETWPYPWHPSPPLTDILVGNGGWSRILTIFVPVNVQSDKDLQVKMTWDRTNRADWNRTLWVRFNEASCPGYATAGDPEAGLTG